ncbi:histidine phosphatase family protein [uncultured Exiguobacterium sp.]|uniref:histidine phosphatase family protein n=1 Tax=uncultured Exiguobacterium sp. TaxID=202669 RepID=UPI0025D57058|nr:histidine phosphatase family protein [uncultured Exiguobacterium sp.]
MSTIYLVRHCETTGQAPEAPLTPRGEEQAQRLCTQLLKLTITHLLSSPYRRALDSIQPLATALKLPVVQEEDLKERRLSAVPLDDWQDYLRRTFIDPDYTCPGGESSRIATERITRVVEEALQQHDGAILVTHGNLLSLYLHSIDPTFGFEESLQLKNPDLFKVTQVDDVISFQPIDLY